MISGKFREQIMQLGYGLVSIAAVGVLIGAIITTPIWVTILILNIPLFIVLGALLMYTNVSSINLRMTKDARSLTP